MVRWAKFKIRSTKQNSKFEIQKTKWLMLCTERRKWHAILIAGQRKDSWPPVPSQSWAIEILGDKRSAIDILDWRGEVCHSSA